MVRGPLLFSLTRSPHPGESVKGVAPLFILVKLASRSIKSSRFQPLKRRVFGVACSPGSCFGVDLHLFTRWAAMFEPWGSEGSAASSKLGKVFITAESGRQPHHQQWFMTLQPLTDSPSTLPPLATTLSQWKPRVQEMRRLSAVSIGRSALGHLSADPPIETSDRGGSKLLRDFVYRVQVRVSLIEFANKSLRGRKG